MNDRFPAILSFWFGAPGTDPMARSSVWYKKDPAFDAEVRSRFGHDIELAARGEFDDWTSGAGAEAAHTALALVVVLDQFSRNAFRDTPGAFANDARALDVSLRAQDKGLDRVLTPVERSFLYMPMMHAESREIQRRSVGAFERLAEEAAGPGHPEAVAKFLASARDFARKHASIVDRFGRFPHRNTVLERTSTGDEVAFLKDGPGF